MTRFGYLGPEGTFTSMALDAWGPSAGGERTAFGSVDGALTALRAGEIDLAFEVLGPMVPQVSAGVVKALAVSSDKRNPALPEVPTVQQTGVAGYNVASWNAIAAPAGTPTEVVDKLNRAVREAVASPAVTDKMARLGMRMQSGTPAELQSLLASEIKRWGEVIRAAKIEPE